AVASAPMLLILTYRTGYAPPFTSRSFHTPLVLHNLSGEEALVMAGRVLGSDEFPAELHDAVMAKAEGVPLFVEEVTKTLLELGVLRREDGGYRLVRRIDEVSVPDTIQGIIMARLDRLGENGKRTVQLASVIGRQFLRRLLERIAGLTHELDGLLGELKTLEIVYELGLLPEPAYIFKHAVIQDVAYQSLLVQRRRELHRAVGTAIEELFADRLAEHHEELAHHFAEGEEWGKAFEYLVRSGDKARDAYANEAAVTHYARALETASRVTPPLPLARLLEVYQRRGRVQILLARNDEAIQGLERILAVARETGDRRVEGEALGDLSWTHSMTLSWDHQESAEQCAEEAIAIGRQIGDARVLAKGLAALGQAKTARGDLDASTRLLEEAMQIGRSLGAPELYIHGLWLLGGVANWRGDFRRALDVSSQAMVEARAIHDDYTESFALAFMCIAHVAVGEYAEGRAVIADALAKARERKNNSNIGRLTNSLGWLHQQLGDFRAALEYDREAAELGRQHKLGNVEISSLINLGLDHLGLGEPARALTLLEETVGRAEKGHGAHRWRWDMRLSVPIAEALLTLGRSAEALRWIERGAATARSTGSAKYLGMLHALRGEVALRDKRWSAAAAELAEALAIARRIEYPALTWQAAHRLAQAQAGAGRGEEALASARLALDTLAFVADRAPDAALRRSFLEWPRVLAAREDLERILRA
ncbi:MAG TPA: tetratricopeptide repeat protein, partial [Candidatus Binatia bacterium]|nr:tetratricopeptide repeat protein [Candidatus Binatia bacterium]